jgi:hypothetical protein
LVTDLEEVSEALRCQKNRSCSLALEKGVGSYEQRE